MWKWIPKNTYFFKGPVMWLSRYLTQHSKTWTWFLRPTWQRGNSVVLWPLCPYHSTFTHICAQNKYIKIFHSNCLTTRVLHHDELGERVRLWERNEKRTIFIKLWPQSWPLHLLSMRDDTDLGHCTYEGESRVCHVNSVLGRLPKSDHTPGSAWPGSGFSF